METKKKAGEKKVQQPKLVINADFAKVFQVLAKGKKQLAHK